MMPNMETVLSIALINMRAGMAEFVKDISIALKLQKIAVNHHRRHPPIACRLNYAHAAMQSLFSNNRPNL